MSNADESSCIDTARQQALWAMVQLSCGAEAILTEPTNAHGILTDAQSRLASAIEAMQAYAALSMPTSGNA